MRSTAFFAMVQPQTNVCAFSSAAQLDVVKLPCGKEFRCKNRSSENSEDLNFVRAAPLFLRSIPIRYVYRCAHRIAIGQIRNKFAYRFRSGFIYGSAVQRSENRSFLFGGKPLKIRLAQCVTNAHIRPIQLKVNEICRISRDVDTFVRRGYLLANEKTVSPSCVTVGRKAVFFALRTLFAIWQPSANGWDYGRKSVGFAVEIAAHNKPFVT